MSTLADTFGKLQQHVRNVPDERKPGLGPEASAAFTAAVQAWDQKLQDFTAPGRLAIGAIRDKKLRHRLNETMTLLEEWQYGLVYAFHGRSRAWVLRGVISHAVECVGAWQRESTTLPEPNFAFREARSSLESKRDEWEAIAEAEEEDRRQLRAQHIDAGS